VLRRAALPLNLLNQPHSLVNTDEYYRLIEAFEAEVEQPEMGLRLGQLQTFDTFEPVMFAAACSPNLEGAIERVSTYRRLMSSLRADVEWVPTGLKVVFHCIDRPRLPYLLGILELTFCVHWVRQATREHVMPTHVGVPDLPINDKPHHKYFGVRPELDSDFSLVFSYNDAQRPFFGARDSVWETFTPELRCHLAELEGTASAQETVRAVLLELLPSGRARKQDVASALGIGERTLQRRLKSEGTSLQQILASTREALARHYLTRTQLTPTEIAYLLDFDDPNSLYRAFQHWTGTTPEAFRRTENGSVGTA